MAHWKRSSSMLAAAIVLVSGLVVLEARDAEAHGRRARRVVFVPGFHGPYFGLGLGPWSAFGPWGTYGPWGTWAVSPQGDRLDTLAVAKMTGWGAVELDVKPNRADVWVDGKYVGEARDLDGTPSYLWLEKGPHRLAIYKGGHRTFEEDVDVERGVIQRVKVRLESGDSPPPGSKTSDEKQ